MTPSLTQCPLNDIHPASIRRNDTSILLDYMYKVFAVDGATLRDSNPQTIAQILNWFSSQLYASPKKKGFGGN